MWNDRQEDQFVCHILDTQTREKRTAPYPIYTVAPDGRTAFTPDFRRIHDMRPGYGYVGIPDPNAEVLAPADAGIWRVDLESGEYELIVTIADIAAIPFPHGDLIKAKHYFNHLLISPDGSRLEFLNRWCRPGVPGWRTRMMTCAPDGSDVRIADDNGMTSHFTWYDTERILAWSRAASTRGDFCMFNVYTGEFETVGSQSMTFDGHVNCLPRAEWLVNGVHPNNEWWKNILYLYHIPTDKRIDIGTFFSAPEYDGEWRCDLHPRVNADGIQIVIDSAYEGNGRQMYLIDVSAIVA